MRERGREGGREGERGSEGQRQERGTYIGRNEKGI